MTVEDLQARAANWHYLRFPEAEPEHVVLKSIEELGEVACALNQDLDKNAKDDQGKGDVAAEAADVVITLLVLLGRWYPTRNLLEEVWRKLVTLETPGAHRASWKEIASAPGAPAGMAAMGDPWED